MRWSDFSQSVEGIVILGLVVSLAASALYDFLSLKDHSIRLRRCLVSSVTYVCCRITNLFVSEGVNSQCDLEVGDYQNQKSDSGKGESDGSGRIAWLLRTTSSSLKSFYRQATDGMNQQPGTNKNLDPSGLDHEPSENDLEPIDADDVSPTGELSSYQRTRRRVTERRKKKKKYKYQSRDSWKAASESNFDFERV